MYKPRIEVVFGNERIISPSGLNIVGAMLGKSDFKKRCDRRKVRTVIENLMLCASHFTKHARRLIMALGCSNTWRHAFWGVWQRFALT